MSYKPPYKITDEVLNKVSIIIEKLDKLGDYSNLNKKPYLRKNSKINSVHSSLAIENNNLSYNQVKDVIDGKIVIGSKKDIQEVKNAYRAYELIGKVDVYSIPELKKVHGIMGNLVVEDAGSFRVGNEGVFDGETCIFVAPPPEMVDNLMNDLFSWIQENKDVIHPLILSSIFHYEFVFIHPFSDGNGRMARLWQNMILCEWRDIFEYLPIESRIYKYQNEYYNAISICNGSGDSTVFIEFMLNMIDETLDDVLASTSTAIDEYDFNINKLIEVMPKGVPMSSLEIMNKLNIKSRKTLKKNYLDRALELKIIRMTLPDKKNSKNQKYYRV